ncbi:MAG: hypothetical protein LQ345_005017 [Seirophora villosa]|nr:MAG: hypothetical protein LQ345_005017 [Seirophora villosa]
MTTVTLESLQPELQTQIMRHLKSGQTLYSLLRASPRFYQVFLTRKEFLLAELARKQFGATFRDAWDAVKVSQFPRPISTETADDFVGGFIHDDSHQQPIFPLSTSIALCNLGATVRWFVDDFWADCLDNIKRLGRLAGLRQVPAVLDSPLSAIEIGRIQRALCRFATLADLLKALDKLSCWRLGQNFLTSFNVDEVEEIGCIRDYLMRRLWRVFETIEDDAMQSDESSPLWRMARAVPGCWFSASLKRSHPIHMDRMTNLGLPFLREVFESRGLKRADLFMANSNSRARGITTILPSSNPGYARDADPFDEGVFVGRADFAGDSLDDFSSGWLYANRGKKAVQDNRESRKGFRDWAYVMLDRDRLAATGVLEKESDASS